MSFFSPKDKSANCKGYINSHFYFHPTICLVAPLGGGIKSVEQFMAGLAWSGDVLAVYYCNIPVPVHQCTSTVLPI